MKKVLISILTLIFIVSTFTIVNAATANIAVGASADSVIIGKTFTVTVAGTADNNITGMQSKLSYDASKLSMESKSAGKGFSDLSGSGEIAIASTGSDSLSKSATLYTITFKVLDTAEVGETTITVSDATLALVNQNSEQENVKVSNDSATITIKKDDTTVDNQGGTEETPDEQKNEVTEDKGNSSTEGNNTTGGNNTNGNNSNSGNKNTNTNKNVNKNTNKNTVKLPQTGAETATVFAIIALEAISIASYLSYKKYKNI